MKHLYPIASHAHHKYTAHHASEVTIQWNQIVKGKLFRYVQQLRANPIAKFAKTRLNAAYAFLAIILTLKLIYAVIAYAEPTVPSAYQIQTVNIVIQDST